VGAEIYGFLETSMVEAERRVEVAVLEAMKEIV